MSILDILDLEAPRQLVPRERIRGRERPHIEVVPDTGAAPSTPSRAPFVLLVLAVLGIGLVGLLMLNTSLQQGAFLVHELETSTAELDEREAVLEQKVAALQAPERLAERARALGMVPNQRPGFLRPDRGTVSGNPKPAEPPPPAAQQPKQASKQASKQSTKQASKEQQQKPAEGSRAPDGGRADE
jgi:hypothetical protein